MSHYQTWHTHTRQRLSDATPPAMTHTQDTSQVVTCHTIRHDTHSDTSQIVTCHTISHVTHPDASQIITCHTSRHDTHSDTSQLVSCHTIRRHILRHVTGHHMSTTRHATHSDTSQIVTCHTTRHVEHADKSHGLDISYCVNDPESIVESRAGVDEPRHGTT